MVLFGESVHFIVRTQISWYNEHYRGYQLEKTDQVTLVAQQNLSDVCPLSAYVVAGMRMVTLKRHICLSC